MVKKSKFINTADFPSSQMVHNSLLVRGPTPGLELKSRIFIYLFDNNVKIFLILFSRLM